MKLTKIGAGWKSISKAGKEYIAINLDPETFSRLYKEDYKKICMFKNSYKEEPKQPDYVLMAPLNEKL